MCEEEENEKKAAIFSGCSSDGHYGNGGGKKRESEDHTAGVSTEGGVCHEGEESETVAPGNKRPLSQEENDMRQ